MAWAFFTAADGERGYADGKAERASTVGGKR